jgi:hypothetical protein
MDTIMRSRGIDAVVLLLAILAACLAACTGPGFSPASPVQTVQNGTVAAPAIPGPVLSTVSETRLNATGNRTEDAPLLPDGPVTLTLHSAKKVLGLGTPGDVYIGAGPGEVFLILDITITNNGLAEGYVFTNRSIGVHSPDQAARSNRQQTSHTAFRKSQEHLLLPPIALDRGESLSGQVIFAVNDSEEYRINLFDNRSGRLSSRVADFRSLLTTQHPVDLTVSDVSKVTNFTSSQPLPGHRFLVLNVTITNHDIKDGFPFTWESVTLQDLRGGTFARCSLNNGPNLMTNFRNPVSPDTRIGWNTSVSGQLVFGIADSPEYRLNLVDANRSVIASRIIPGG